MDRNAAERQEVYAWGRLEPRADVVVPASFADEMAAAIRASDKRPLLCRGLGRSYGDVGLNTGGYLLDTARADHFLSADWETGLVRAEAGLSPDALLRICVPRGWFLPVSPGSSSPSAAPSPTTCTARTTRARGHRLPCAPHRPCVLQR
jgi:FAD/FMN-containing dehydrogenase